ncbi:predicted protein [Streptomyces viridosporus ATCC 14672]|uniref:Predicted protein n=1 Tax=Streptomyces viridosporus (strain ATCC 14672 / DSM 40746 / JCM 4963 / KCTC 9882 / NRRL B-12104 / FH 1290) TaxID=566461 RepID=D6AA23_STRV1|nr:predicted protein [Streptomyces viridosporus ATCC 14672]
MKCEAGEAGQLAGTDGLDPDGEPGSETAGEDLAEIPDMAGGGIQFRATSQEALSRWLMARDDFRVGHAGGSRP